MEARAINRRIGQRLPMRSSKVLWRVPAPGEKRSRRRKPQPGRLLDASVSGLRLEAPADDDLLVGMVVHVAVGGAVGPVRIRSIGPGPVPGERTYGLELADPGSRLTLLVHRKVAEAADAPADW